MKKEMININANLLDEPSFTSFERDSERVEAVNFTLYKSMGRVRNTSIAQRMVRRWRKQEIFRKAI